MSCPRCQLPLAPDAACAGCTAVTDSLFGPLPHGLRARLRAWADLLRRRVYDDLLEDADPLLGQLPRPRDGQHPLRRLRHRLLGWDVLSGPKHTINELDQNL